MGTPRALQTHRKGAGALVGGGEGGNCHLSSRHLSSCHLSSMSIQVPGCSGALGQLGERSREPVGTLGHQGRGEGTPRAGLAGAGDRAWAEEERSLWPHILSEQQCLVLQGKIQFVKGQFIFINSI